MNIPQPTQQQHSERAYLHTMIAGAFLPFFQSLMLGLVVTIAVWLIAALVFDVLDPHKPAILCGVLAWATMLWRLLRHWINLTTIENFIGVDLNRDGVIGDDDQPEAEEEAPQVIRVQLVKDNGHVSDMIDLPASRDQLSALANGLHNGLPFSEKFWTGKGKPFSTNQFRNLRDVMMKRELAEYVNDEDPRAGIRLTEAGAAVLETFRPHSPTPESEA